MLDTDQGAVYRLKVKVGTAAAIKALSRNPAVAFVEPNYKLLSTAAVTSTNDPYYTSGSLWGMYSDDSPTVYGPSGTTNAFGSGAEEAWSQGYTGSSSVVVAVLDEGIQITHPDLAANIWTNPYEVAGDGIDNDGNGFVDDVNGWDFYYGDNTVYDSGEDAHGTHVAGTIGGVGGNGIGVSGVSPNVQIISTKFLGPWGGYTSDAVAAINYLTDLKTRNNVNLVAINNSWGGGGYSSTLHSAILRAAKADILFVAAAGNSTVNTDTTANWPSNYSTLQASATESSGQLRVGDLGGVHHLHRRAVVVLQLRRFDGRHRRSGFGHPQHCARRLRELQRNVDGSAACDRGDRALEVLQPRIHRRGFAHHDPGQRQGHHLADGQDRHRRNAEHGGSVHRRPRRRILRRWRLLTGRLPLLRGSRWC